VVIHFRNLEGIDYPWLLAMLQGSFISHMNTLVVPGGKMGLAMELIIDAAGAAADGREADRVVVARWRCTYRAYGRAYVGRVSEAPPAKKSRRYHLIRMGNIHRFLQHERHGAVFLGGQIHRTRHCRNLSALYR